MFEALLTFFVVSFSAILCGRAIYRRFARGAAACDCAAAERCPAGACGQAGAVERVEWRQ